MKTKFLFNECTRKLVQVPYDDTTATHNIKVRENPDAPGLVVFVDPPIPGVGDGRKTFRSMKKAAKYGAGLFRKPCLICEMGGTHSDQR